MLLLALLLAMISARSGRAFLTKNHTNIVICSGMIFNDTYYDRKTVYKGSGRSLFMHDSSGDLFFSHAVRNESGIGSQLVACHVESKTCRNIEGIRGGFTVGYDRKVDRIYFGGIDGIYVYNNVTDAAEFYAEEGNSVWALFILNNFYYIEYPSQHLYVKKGNDFVTSTIKAEVLTFHATEDRIYYSNRTGLYTCQKKASAEPSMLSTSILVRQITQDVFGRIYFCAQDGIYTTESQKSKSLKKLAYINDAYGMAFMNIHKADVFLISLIYSDENNVYRLLPSRHSAICYTAVLNAVENSEQKLRQNKPVKVFLNLKLDFQ